MRFSKSLAFALLLMCCVAAAGRDKKKILLPADVLQAQTVLVVIDPDAGMPLDAPNANRTAQQAVENALMNWGRFRLVPEVSTADLVIVIRKGNGKIAQPTIGGLPTNSRPVTLQPGDSGGRAGRQRRNSAHVRRPYRVPHLEPHAAGRSGSGRGYLRRLSRQA
jgi:hypothetical protein